MCNNSNIKSYGKDMENIWGNKFTAIICKKINIYHRETLPKKIIKNLM
jgi:hypothetical protein